MTADRLQAALQSALWIGLGLALCWLIALLGPILTPFLLAATLAYIGNPLVLRLTNRGLPRIVAVLLLMALLIALIALFVLALVPLLAEEGRQLITRLPDLINLINDRWAPWWRARAAEGHAFGSHSWDHDVWLGDLPGGFRVRPTMGAQAGRSRTLDAAAYCAALQQPA